MVVLNVVTCNFRLNSGEDNQREKLSYLRLNLEFFILTDENTSDTKKYTHLDEHLMEGRGQNSKWDEM